MERLDELPKETRRFPNFRLIEGKLDLLIGPSCLGWRLGVDESVRFNRHGTFTVVSIKPGSAILQVKLPRKGWNPEGPNHHAVVVPARCEVTIRKGAIHVRQIPDKEWSQIEAKERHRREYREMMERRYSQQFGNMN
ncbi:MAG: hypothetical protein AAB449_01520 [Patescibacteria group bacterium]